MGIYEQMDARSFWLRLPCNDNSDNMTRYPSFLVYSIVDIWKPNFERVFSRHRFTEHALNDIFIEKDTKQFNRIRRHGVKLNVSADIIAIIIKIKRVKISYHLNYKKNIIIIIVIEKFTLCDRKEQSSCVIV
mgnify:CR=1 FL=1